MREEIKCPHCGGNRYENIDAKTVKCLYCGSVFILNDKDDKDDEYEKIKKEKEEAEFFAQLGKDIRKTEKSKNLEDVIEYDKSKGNPNEVKIARLILIFIVVIIILTIMI